MSDHTERWSSLDPRSLALFRIGLGLVVVLDQILRLRDLLTFYTDSGILPRTTLLSTNLSDFWISLHMSVGGGMGECVLLLVTAGCGLCLSAGWRTPQATLACWIMLNSLHARNPFVNDRGDSQLVIMLLWGLFLPLGAVWSVDARRGNKIHGSAVGFPAAALIVQLSLIYLFAALTKTGSYWLARGDALEYSLQSAIFATDFAAIVHGLVQPYLKAANYLVIASELFVGLLILTPFSVGLLRGFAVALIVGFHLTVALLFHLGLFPLIGLVSIVALIPAEFWRARPKLPETQGSRSTTKAKISRDLCLASILGLAVVSNIGSLTWGLPWDAPTWLKAPARVLKIDQHWDLFSPLPPISGQFQVLGVHPTDGERLIHRLPKTSLDSEAPDFPNHRWRMLLLTTLFPDYPEVQHTTALELARKGGGLREGERLKYQFLLFPMEQNGGYGEPRPLILWEDKS